jgi:hypothetical protein
MDREPAKHWRGKMTDYMQILLNVCFTMVTGVIIVGGFGTMVFLALMFWNMIKDEL